jgi:hypothetical protein
MIHTPKNYFIWRIKQFAFANEKQRVLHALGREFLNIIS